MIYFQDPAQTGKTKAEVEEILSFISYHLFLYTQLFPTHPGNPLEQAQPVVWPLSPQKTYSVIFPVSISTSHGKDLLVQFLLLLLLVLS